MVHKVLRLSAPGELTFIANNCVMKDSVGLLTVRSRGEGVEHAYTEGDGIA